MSSRPRFPGNHDLRVDRRQFLLALGAVPLLAQGCGEAESQGFREANLEEVEDVATPLTAQAASLSIKVARATKSQSFNDNEQKCSVPDTFHNKIAVGDQVRLVRKASQYALYTVADLRKTDNPDKVRLGLEARLRLGTSTEFSGTLKIPVVAVGLTDEQAQAQSEFVERLDDDGSNSGLLVIAPHGGIIESNTDRQAQRVTTLLAGHAVSSWICKGYKQGGGAYERWHITSTEISPRSFPGLGLIANRGFAYCVSFHGMSTGGVLIGGAAPKELKQTIRAAILAAIDDSDISVHLATSKDQYNGDSPDNLVNWLTAEGGGGVQIEQDYTVRTHYWQAVADAVADVYQQLV